MSAAQEFKAQKVILLGPAQRDAAITKLNNVPLGYGLEMIIRPIQKVRGLDANSRMWAGPLKDIAEQAWVGGRLYSDEVWHEQFKAEYLPELDSPELDMLVKDPETYIKWDFNSKGDRVLVGSTTQLTKHGFALYLQQVESFGASLGVMFSASPRERAA